MRVCALGSGSKGNSIYIDGGDNAILIDNGLSFRELLTRLNRVGLDAGKIKAVLITHEHSDHIKGVNMLCKNLGVEVYSPHDCYLEFVGKMPDICYAGANRNYESGFSIYGFDIKPFRTPHDSVYSVGYKVSFEDKSVALATDLGVVTAGVEKNIIGSDFAIIEANHDIDMLKHGKYPDYLKARILGNGGHLSNEAMSKLMVELVENGTEKFVLAHLSEGNNLPTLAYNEADIALHNKGIDSRQMMIEVANQYVPTKIFEV